MVNKKLTIKSFWWFNNATCWKIKRQGFVDMYLYLPTMRYIYKTAISKEWKGTKNPNRVMMTEKQRSIVKVKTFSDEDAAVRWLAGERVK